MAEYKIHKGEIHQMLEVRDSNGEKITDFKENLKKGCIEIPEQPKKRGNPNCTTNPPAKKENPLSERISFRLLPEDYESFVQAAGSKRNLKNFILNACYEAARLKRIMGF